MRSEEAHGQEERLCTLFLEEGDGLRGDLAVGLLGVGAVGGEPAQRATVVTGTHKDLSRLALGLVGRASGADADREDFVLVVAITTAGIPDLFPRLRVVETVGADLLRYAIVVELADTSDGVAVILKHLRHRYHVWNHFAEFLRVIVDAGGVGTKAREERSAAWIAESVLAVGAIEADAGAGEGVDVRRERRASVSAHASAAVIGDE